MITAFGTDISDHLIRRVAQRLAKGEDWQKVGTGELRTVIPEGGDDLDELNEVLAAAEAYNDASGPGPLAVLSAGNDD